jgi:hypothetical protein
MSPARAAVNERRRGGASLDWRAFEHGRVFQRQSQPEPPYFTVITVGSALTFSSRFATGRTWRRRRPVALWDRAQDFPVYSIAC